MRRIEFYFRETASGIRRNGTVAFGAVSTAFIALFLFGLALLIRREIDLVIEGITGNVQVAVYVDDTAAAHPETITHLQQLLQGLPAVDTVVYEDKEATCERAQKVFAANRDDHRERALLRVSDIVAGDAEGHESVRTDHGRARVRAR